MPLGEVSSTLDVAQESAGQYPNPTWFTATRQTAPRGRRGRTWVETEGNFAATLTLPIENPAEAAFRSFIAALAVADALDAFVKTPASVSLKWPNDALLDGRKVAGILLESLSAQNRIWGVAIGIGVNLAAAPPFEAMDEGAVAPVALADIIGQTISPEDFLTQLAPAFAQWEQTFQTNGFTAIRTAWLARAAKLGEVITARTVRDTHTGTFDTVDDAGQLVLNTPQGRITVPAADVYF
ncbi:MAG: biotin--[acetyl-CoA-carboxylase] ligase [Silicimonas sp.]|nr:biotin--[acetyl-CoA-carboxylase] ligase [Silicimonas sp.]